MLVDSASSIQSTQGKSWEYHWGYKRQGWKCQRGTAWVLFQQQKPDSHQERPDAGPGDESQ